MATSSVNKPNEEPQGTQSQTFNETATNKKDKNSLLVSIVQSNPIRGIENDLNSEMPNVDLKKQSAGGQNAIQVIKEQEGPTDIICYTDTIQAKKVVKVPENDLSFSNSLELTTETELGKKSAGNLVNASDAITDNESEGDNSSETVECAERCKGSDEELPKTLNQSSEGYTGNPDDNELSNTCTAGCKTGNSGNGSDCIDNEKVASEDELASSVIPLQENDTEEIAIKIMCEKKIGEKPDEKDSEGQMNVADRKFEGSSSEIDEVKGVKGAKSKSTTVTRDKTKFRFTTNVFHSVENTYKFYKRFTKSFCLQTIFIVIMFRQSVPEFSASENTIIGHLHENMIQNFHIGNQENTIFPVLENHSALMFLPQPNLPGPTVDLVNALGINLRPEDQNTTNSGSSDRSQLRVDNSQSIQHTGTSSGGHQSNDEVQRSSEFISISSSPLTATVREGENDSRQVQCTRINDVPALPVPNQLSLDEGSTNRKETQPVRNIFTNVIQSRQSADGSPSSATTNLRDRNIPTVGTYSLERIPEYASHLSNSVSEQPSQQISDDMVFGEEQMTNILARVRTFDDRWPHRHLNPGDMARAGFFFTGEEDMTRCFDCDIGLGKWETDDCPFNQHRMWSPECAYIQRLCQNNPQFFGASGQDGRTVNSDLVWTENAASVGQQNNSQGLGNRSIYTRQEYRQMNRENSGRLVPHCEHGDNDCNIYSELLQAQSCESEHTGIQESGTYTGLTMFAVTENSRTLQDFPNLDSADVNELIGTDQTFDAIDYRGSQEVIMVLSEGYSQREVDIAVESLLNEDSIITVNALRYKLQYLGFTPKI